LDLPFGERNNWNGVKPTCGACWGIRRARMWNGWRWTGEIQPRSMQHFIGQSPWKLGPVIAIHQRLVAETLGCFCCSRRVGCRLEFGWADMARRANENRIRQLHFLVLLHRFSENTISSRRGVRELMCDVLIMRRGNVAANISINVLY
jgi:hypothetical protein